MLAIRLECRRTFLYDISLILYLCFQCLTNDVGLWKIEVCNGGIIVPRGVHFVRSGNR